MTAKKEKPALDFMTARFAPRQKTLSFPDLEGYHVNGKSLSSWKIRGLSGNELGRAMQAAKENKKAAQMVEKVLSKMGAEKADGVLQMYGLDGSVDQTTALYIELVIAGSVEPVCSLDLALKFCQAWPIEFRETAERIYELTGKGHEPGKAQPSGKTPE